jgi:hypothetical protein
MRRQMTHLFLAIVFFIAACSIAHLLSGTGRVPRSEVGRYQGHATNTFFYVLDTKTGKVRAFHMKLDVMQAICIEGTVPCNQ